MTGMDRERGGGEGVEVENVGGTQINHGTAAREACASDHSSYLQSLPSRSGGRLERGVGAKERDWCRRLSTTRREKGIEQGT